ncbi:MAG TPA: beta-ketoacyl synthase N-terminal-like domain-containing protein, partial [Bryobacteraceae bacterium]|nr:beta-ketoacyl synthase N-terminal-like domain-containing protein [Bryobacteraceae bacterium]
MSERQPSSLSAARLALGVNRLRQQMPDTELLASNPLAIIGIGCRFPGNVQSPRDFWHLLLSGTDAITTVPRDRWDAGAYYDSDAYAPGRTNTKWGGFLDHPASFDPHLFGIAPREAPSIDPQQRLLLEVAWEAIWDSGRSPESLAGSRAGVFTGITRSDYERLLFEDAHAITANSCTGAYHSVATGRLSYLLDLHGPSVSIDTACSSSLVAVHAACQSLRSGECDLALAGGVNLQLLPEHYVGLAKLGMLAADGRCKTFDASADGFVPSEGCGVIVLKRLSEALADGDRIYAVIRGVATNQDGRTKSLTAPSGLAQQDVVRRALENGRVSPESISYVETHGTGTALGDPIEIEALGAVLGSESLTSEACFLGAVKTNLGHLEAAAGIAGLIKATLALYYEAVPANIHFKSLNPHILLDGTRFVVPAQAAPWPRGPQARFAGVSSFGFSGTNAHVVVEEAPRIPERADSQALKTPSTCLLPLSARTPEALTEFARRYQTFLREEGRHLALADICSGAGQRYSHYEERLGIAASSHAELCSLLEDFVKGRLRHGTANGRAAQDTGVVFVCSGQGSQWARMGMVLLREEPLFRAALQECDDCVRQLAGWSLLAEIELPPSESKLGETEYAQPALLAVEIALARLWASWGVRPAAIIGHSAGEVAAACIAGILPLDEAMRVVVQRGRLMQAATGQGKMATVRLPATTVAKELAAAKSDVSIAAVNSPQSTVISGNSEAVQSLVSLWLARGIASRLLPVNYAFHSGQMQSYSEQMVRILGSVKTGLGTVPVLSTVLGRPALGHEFDAPYWGRNIRRTVQFRAAVDVALAMGYSNFLEVGPHPVLLTSVSECLTERNTRGVLVPSLRRNEDERKSMLTSLGALYVDGQPISWSAVYPKPGLPVALPAYPYQKQRFWIQPAIPSKPKNALHPLVGSRLRSPAIRAAVFEAEIGTASLPYLADHSIEGEAVVPMAALLEMAACAAREIFNSAMALEDVCVLKRFVLPKSGQSVGVQVLYEGDRFQIYSRAGDDWVMHASGRVSALGPLEQAPKSFLDSEWKDSVPDFYYDRCRENGAAFGPAFRTIRSLSIGNGRARAEVGLRDAERKEAARYGVHPALLDGCLQAALAAMGECKELFLPFALDRMECFEAAGEAAGVDAALRPSASEDVRTADIDIRDPNGRLLARISGMHYKRRAPETPAAAPLARRLYKPAWRRAERGATGPRPQGTLLVLADEPDACSALVIALQEAGLTAAVLGMNEGLDGRPCGGVIRLAGFAPADDPMDAQASICGATLDLAQDMLRCYPVNTPQLIVVTRGAAVCGPTDRGEGFRSAPVWGLIRTVALEHPELRCLLADVDGSAFDWSTLAEEIARWDGEPEVALRSGERYVRRLAGIAPANASPRQWTVSARGSIENLTLESCERRAPAAGEIEIEVEANALNFRDVLNVLGMYPGDAGQPGVEFCGRLASVGADVNSYAPGERVMGIAWHSLRRFVTTPAELVVPAPPTFNAVDAATLPNAFLTAYHCLIHLGRLRRGERVLIHCASGGVGLAAVQLAQHLGAEVFATAGSEKKRDYLHSLGVRHVFSSRTVDFAEEIAAVVTGSVGIDLILNSLTGNSVDASFSLLANGGRFIEIGVRDIWSPEKVQALN